MSVNTENSLLFTILSLANIIVSCSSQNNSSISDTVLETLKKTPETNVTYLLGEKQFNEYFLNNSRIKKNLTFFAPTSNAWLEYLQNNFPMTFKLINENPGTASYLLERHLIVSEEPFTKKKIIEGLQNGGIALPAIRSEMYINITNENGSDFLFWRGDKILLNKTDLMCSNGVIHILDGILLKTNEIMTVGFQDKLRTSFVIVFITFMTLLYL